MVTFLTYGIIVALVFLAFIVFVAYRRRSTISAMLQQRMEDKREEKQMFRDEYLKEKKRRMPEIVKAKVDAQIEKDKMSMGEKFAKTMQAVDKIGKSVDTMMVGAKKRGDQNSGMLSDLGSPRRPSTTVRRRRQEDIEDRRIGMDLEDMDTSWITGPSTPVGTTKKRKKKEEDNFGFSFKT